MKYYVLKRHDGTFNDSNGDSFDGKNTSRFRMYSEADRLQFGKEWAPYFTFAEMRIENGALKFYTV